MRTVSALLFATAPFLSLAAPLRRAAAPGDILVANFANVLELLETEFYKQALAKFQASDFQAAGYSSAQIPTEQFQNIMKDEAAHQKTLSGAISSLGGTEVQGCKFNFDSVLTDVATMAATARVVEAVGVGAYLGAAHLVEDPRILTAAASILTIEARHQTILNVMSGSGTAIPQAFDMALTPSEVLGIAGGFISGCDLGVPANPALKITNTGVPTVGTALTFQWDGMPSDTSSFFCQMLVGGAVNTISLPLNQCVVPATVNGPVAIWVTKDSNPLLGSVIDRNPVLADKSTAPQAGPALAFIDSQSESLSQVVRTVPGVANSTSTENISPAEASSVASAAGASATSSSGSGSSTSGPNLATGPGADGTVVLGWQNLPPSSS